MLELADDLVLQVDGLRKHFPVESGFLRKKVTGHVRAVDDVSFSIRTGGTLGLVGESGCGKTTAARTIIRALDPTSGRVVFRTRDGVVDMASLGKPELKSARRDMQLVFQDPYSSLNPRMPVLDIIAEPMAAHGFPPRQREERVEELMTLVGLRPEYVRRFPHSFSGGQRQRIGVARALALNPSLVVADEAVSALDVSVQAQVLNLLIELQERLGLSYLFVSHNLSVIRYLCDQVAVMYLGRIVELADVDSLYDVPRHPYTSALLGAVPDADPRSVWRRQVVKGEVTHAPTSEIAGCPFAPRCPFVQEICRTTAPPLKEVAGSTRAGSETHLAACHFADELVLEGVG
jgi:oligopeptide/dipeptide ABC transporter ATP-binding protein